MNVGVIVLAAGSSSRFGENKLLQYLGEKKVLEHTLDVLRNVGFKSIVVVTNEETWQAISPKTGLTQVIHANPEKGISYSIRCGLEAAESYEAYLFVVGDQPLLSKKTIEAVCQLNNKYPEYIVGAGFEGVLMNPVIFPGKYKSKLMTLSGDRGGKWLIKKENLKYKVFECVDEEQLWDVDTPADYEAIIRRIKNGIT